MVDNLIEAHATAHVALAVPGVTRVDNQLQAAHAGARHRREA
jgi:hypothetical protein